MIILEKNENEEIKIHSKILENTILNIYLNFPSKGQINDNVQSIFNEDEAINLKEIYKLIPKYRYNDRKVEKTKLISREKSCPLVERKKKEIFFLNEEKKIVHKMKFTKILSKIHIK